MKAEGLTLVDGVETDSVHVQDRGLQYGDGVFRTLKVESGQMRWWQDHYRKLYDDCSALRIPCPDLALLEAEARQIAAKPGVGAVKIMITRGAGPRGYRMVVPGVATRIVMGFKQQISQTDVIQARWCALRLSRQPHLAGIKHLNRLENILARSEWNDPAIAEGLLVDEADQVICGTMSNLFIVEAAGLITPDLSQCGVAGVARQRILRAASKHGQKTEVGSISRERLLAAEQVLLCNSLFGIWRIEKLADRLWADNGWTNKLRYWLNEDS